jgi:hypothetical protein
MPPQWYFTQARPGDRARESQVEKFFRSDAVANRAEAIVREGIQNSLDAGEPGRHVHVRLVLGEWTAAETVEKWSRYGDGLAEHVKAPGAGHQLPDPPRSDEQLRYLVFEDFGTTGLRGDPAQWWPEEGHSNPFFNYFRAEGISDKAANERGRHGVGRLVFMFASRVRAMFGLTRRAEQGTAGTLLMGTSVLRNHWLHGTPFLPDGLFGVRDAQQEQLVLPVGDPATIAAFTRDFQLERREETGLSIVVPWLDHEITREAILEAVLGGYFYPVLQNRLSVDVVAADGHTDLITASSIDAVLATQPATTRERLEPLVKLARTAQSPSALIELVSPLPMIAQTWNDASIPELAQQSIRDKLEQGEPVSLHVPVSVRPKSGGGSLASAFDIHMERVSKAGEDRVLFIREGIVISDVRPRRAAGIRALVVIEAGPLAAFLGDSENPSHTQWQKDTVKPLYVHAPALLKYVINSVAEILAILSRKQNEPDSSLLIDLFSLHTDAGRVRPRTAPGSRAGNREPPEVREIPTKPKRYRVSKRADGFVVQPGDAGTLPPPELMIRVAYGVRRGSPFTKYDPADFRLDSRDIHCTLHGCTELERRDNRLRVRINQPDFEVVVGGFDTRHRDLYVDARPVGEGPAANDADADIDEEQVDAAAI